MELRDRSAYIAEFLGTMLLVGFITMVLSTNLSLTRGFPDLAVIGLVHAFLLMMLIATLGGASGAHFNPAVTIALTAIRKIAPRDAGIYIICQLAGGIVGALIVRAILTDEGGAVKYGANFVSHGPPVSTTTFGGFVAEILGTFVLMWAIMGTAVNVRAPKDWAPWVIGGTLGFAVMAIGPITGAGFNPARSLGPAVVAGDFGGVGTFLLAFVLGPVIGALLAAFTYTAVVLVPQERLFGGRLVSTDTPPGRVRGQVESLQTPGERPVDKLD
jgi:MIP family channel proteins